MLLDRQNSVISLKSMGTELMSSTKSVEFEQAEKLLKNITVRFEELISSAEKRMSILEKVIPLAQEFQTEVVTVEEWLETTEKKLLSMSSVPVEDDRLKHMIAEQKVCLLFLLSKKKLSMIKKNSKTLKNIYVTINFLLMLFK